MPPRGTPNKSIEVPVAAAAADAPAGPVGPKKYLAPHLRECADDGTASDGLGVGCYYRRSH